MFQLSKGQLLRIKEKKIDLERDIQKITEQNLNAIFGVSLIKSELTIHNFRIDTLAFDDEKKSFVIIEYKRDKDFSVIDQGVTYLSLMLNNKSDFVLEYNERKSTNLKRDDVDWSQSKIIFIADIFNQYQTGALGFKDLPIELWQAKLFEEGIIVFSPLKSLIAPKATIKTVRKDYTAIDKVTKEVKIYNVEYHFKQEWKQSKALYEKFREQVMQLYPDISERFTKFYIAFIDENTNKSFVEIVSRKKGIKIYLRPSISKLKSPIIKLGDCSKIGHWTNGNTYFILSKEDEIPYSIELIKQAYLILRKI